MNKICNKEERDEKEDQVSKGSKKYINIKIADTSVANDGLGVSQKYERKVYDNGYKRQKCRDDYFSKTKSRKDHITGETVHSSDAAAKAKYGKKNYTKHTSDADHINSLERVHKKLKKNPYLTDKDVKEIANHDSNYRMTQRKLNRVKKESSNTRLAYKNKDNLSAEAKAKLVCDELKSTTNIYVNTAKRTAINVTGEFTNGAVNSVKDAGIPIMIEAVNNLVKVANNEKDLGEATKDMVTITTKVAVTGGGVKVATTGLTNVLKNSSSEALKKIGQSNHVGKIVVVAALVADSAYKYFNGEINGNEFFEEIGEKGVGLIGGTIGYMAGQMLIPIPVVGGLIGSMIVSFVCEDIYRTIMTLNDYKERALNVIKIAEDAKEELDKHRKILSKIVENDLKYIDVQNDLGFKLIYNGVMNDDGDAINEGIKAFASIIDKDLAFKNNEEFDDFFMDENAEFTF